MRKVIVSITCVAISGLCALAQVRELPIPAAGAAVENQYIVTFKAGTTQSDRATILARAGARVLFNYKIIDAAAISVPNANVLGSLSGNLSVERITPDRISVTMAKPGGGGGTGAEEIVGEGVKRVGLPASGNPYNIGVAVLDTGVARVADLSVGADYFDGYGGTCNDVQSHGTHVSGIIGAIDNAIGVLGVAPGVTIYCGKVLNDSGSGTDSTIVAGLDWVGVEGAGFTPPIRIVNMSLGRLKAENDMNGPMHNAIKSLAANGIAVVVAAGNDGSREVSQMVPAGFPEVIAVASATAIAGTNQCSRLASPVAADTASYFTTDGKLDTLTGIGVTISAYGEDKENVSRGCFLSSVGILSLSPAGGTARMSGTSQAAPHVSGIVARMLHLNPDLGLQAIRTALRPTVPAPTVPLHSPASSYTFDEEYEGVAKAPAP